MLNFGFKYYLKNLIIVNSLWQLRLQQFSDYLLLERAAPPNTLEAYLADVQKLAQYAQMHLASLAPELLMPEHLDGFMAYLYDFGLSTRTQARIISGIKTFYKYLLINDLIHTDPSAQLDAPQLGRYLPSVLSVSEVEKIIAVTDLDANETLRLRNRAMIEVLYACGLRVTELVELRISNLFLDAEMIKITGKGNKERLVPIGDAAIAALRRYLTDEQGRTAQTSKIGEGDFVFLNRRGAHLSRNMFFMLVQKWAQQVGIKRAVSPHTFRHSFATHLIEGGADLRAVQEMLGHESIITTEIYTHLDTDFLRQTILLHHPRNKSK